MLKSSERVRVQRSHETVCPRTSELLKAFKRQSRTWKQISFQLREILSGGKQRPGISAAGDSVKGSLSGI